MGLIVAYCCAGVHVCACLTITGFIVLAQFIMDTPIRPITITTSTIFWPNSVGD